MVREGRVEGSDAALVGGDSAISSASLTTSATFRPTRHTIVVSGGNLRNLPISSSGIGYCSNQQEIEDEQHQNYCNSIGVITASSISTCTTTSGGSTAITAVSSALDFDEESTENNIIGRGIRGENGGTGASGYFGSSGGGGAVQNNYSNNSNNPNSDNIRRRGSGGSRRRLLRSRRRANIFQHHRHPQQQHNNNQKDRIMASRGGPMVEGTDGTDFQHRQRVASQYQLSALNKSRLKNCIFLHFVLYFALLLKLIPYILDRLDIFILELEELDVPKVKEDLYFPRPLKWEYWYCLSLPGAFIGLSAIRKNNVQAMRVYTASTFSSAVLPVLLGIYSYFGDVYAYISTRSLKDVQVWQGYPYGVLWYIFLIIALQIHVFSMIFASKLKAAWELKGSARKAD